MKKTFFAIFVLLALSSCSSNEKKQDANDANQQQSATKTKDSSDKEKIDVNSYTAGLSPLPSPSTVLSSVEIGRVDPFTPPTMRQSFAFGQNALDLIKSNLVDQITNSSDEILDSFVSLEALKSFQYHGFIKTDNTTMVKLEYLGRNEDVRYDGKSFFNSGLILPREWVLKSFDSQTGALEINNKRFSIFLYPGNVSEQVSSVSEQLKTIFESAFNKSDFDIKQ